MPQQSETSGDDLRVTTTLATHTAIVAERDALRARLAEAIVLLANSQHGGSWAMTGPEYQRRLAAFLARADRAKGAG